MIFQNQKIPKITTVTTTPTTGGLYPLFYYIVFTTITTTFFTNNSQLVVVVVVKSLSLSLSSKSNISEHADMTCPTTRGGAAGVVFTFINLTSGIVVPPKTGIIE